MEVRKIEYHTIEDIYNLPEGQRAELVDGQIYYMASPSRSHQRILMALSVRIYNHINEKKGSCEVYPAPFAVFINNDERTYLEPDISVICDPSKLDDKGCHGAPDLIIEIISPGSTSHDYIRKYALYEKAGVREYWVVDPQNKAITVCTFPSQSDDPYPLPDRYSFDDQVKVGIFDDLTIDFREIEV